MGRATLFIGLVVDIGMGSDKETFSCRIRLDLLVDSRVLSSWFEIIMGVVS